MTAEQMIKDGFCKVSQSGGCFVTALFVNVDTWETRTERVRDYDYDDCSRDNDELYYMPIDKAAAEAWRKHLNIVEAGDIVKVVKGRKVPIGTIARVERVYNWRDCYGRTQTTYAVFENGMKTSVNNCEIIA